MADPLSFAASIAGLVSIADVVLRRTYRYIRGVKNAERHVTELCATVNSVFGVLKSIELVVEELKTIDNLPNFSQKEIVKCLETLEHMRKKLSSFENPVPSQPSTNGKIHLSTSSKLTWPFSSVETMELVEKMNDHKALLTMTLTADNLAMSVEIFGQNKANEANLQKTYTLLEAETKITMDKRKEEKLRLLSPVRPLDNHKTNNSLRHKGTGVWFLETDEFKQWISSRNGALWVWGIPGAGKTILASVAIQEALEAQRISNDNDAVAYFYCDYKTAESQQPANVLGSLARDIARQNDGPYAKLETFLETQRIDSRHKLGDADIPELSRLILRIARHYDTVTILVDGLDECGDYARMLTSHLACLSRDVTNVRTFLSSRDIPQIRDMLESFDGISIAARNSDLKLYVGSEIEERLKKSSVKRLYLKDIYLKGLIMDKLVEGAQGMFRWVALQLDIICEEPSDKAIIDALQTLPHGLYASYERILQIVNQKPKATQTLVRRTLNWIIAYGGMKISQLCEAISIEPGSTRSDPHGIVDIETILRCCGSFVRRNGDIIELAHFTVKEFLTSVWLKDRPDLAHFWHDEGTVNKYLAYTCLTYLCYTDFGLPCSSFQDLLARDDQFPFWGAAVSSMGYMCKDEAEHEIMALVQKLFSEVNKGKLYSWAQTYLLYKICGVDGISEETFNDVNDFYSLISPLHYAAMLTLPRSCSWILAQQPATAWSSPIGSPIHCALLGHLVFSEFDTVSAYFTIKFGIDIAKVLSGILHILIPAETEADDQWTCRKSGKHVSTLYLAFTYFPNEHRRVLLERLLKAGHRCYPDFLEKLLVSGKDIIDLVKQENLHDSSMEIYRRILMRQTQQGNEAAVAMVESLLSKSHVNPKVMHDLFFNAVREGCVEFVERLLVEQALDVNMCDNEGSTALHLAAEVGRIKIVEELIKRGADIRAIDRQGFTPWARAIETHERDVASLLRSKVLKEDATTSSSIAQKDFQWGLQSALAAAIRRGDIYLCRRLMEQGACLSSPCGPCGSCLPLLYALDYKQLEISRFIINEGGSVAGIACKAHRYPRYTALHYVALYGDITTFTAIIKREPTLLFVETAVHPIHMAILHKQNAFLETLLESTRVSWESSFCDAEPSLNGEAQPELAPKLKDKSYQLTGPNLLDLPTRSPSFFHNWTIPTGITPLHCAVYLGKIEAVNLLLKAGASVNRPEPRMQTPLGVAIKKRKAQIAGILLEFEANPHSRTRSGRPLRRIALKNKDMTLYGRLRGPEENISGEDLRHILVSDAVQELRLLLSKGLNLSLYKSGQLDECWRYDVPFVQTYLLNCGHELGAEDRDYGTLERPFPARFIRLSLLKRLLKKFGRERSSQILNKQTSHWFAPLYDAALHGERALLLLKHGANPDVIGGDLGTPLMVAARMGRLRLVQLLIDSGALVSYEHEGKWVSVLEQAKQFPDIVKWLLDDRWTRLKFLEDGSIT